MRIGGDERFPEEMFGKGSQRRLPFKKGGAGRIGNHMEFIVCSGMGVTPGLDLAGLFW